MRQAVEAGAVAYLTKAGQLDEVVDYLCAAGLFGTEAPVGARDTAMPPAPAPGAGCR